MRKTYLNQKDAHRDYESNGPILAPRSLFWSRFVRKTYLSKKDAHRDSEPNAPILMPRSLFWSRLVRKVLDTIYLEVLDTWQSWNK